MLTLERDLTINGQRFLMHEAIRNNQGSTHFRVCKILERNGFPPLVQRLVISMLQRKTYLRPQSYQVVRILESFRDNGFFTLEKQLEQILLPVPVSSPTSESVSLKDDKKRYSSVLLNGRYKMIRKIDTDLESGIICFLCTDTKNNDKEVSTFMFLHFGAFTRNVSNKIIHTLIFTPSQLLKYQFHNEHIIQKLEEFSDDKSFYIITTYLKGGNLLDFCKSNKLAEEKSLSSLVKNAMIQICEAVIHIHERKKVHLGICCENIRFHLSSWQSIEIMISVLDSVLDVSEIEKGIPKQLLYNVFIPEYHARHSDKELSFASDIFSLGMVFYQLLTRDLVCFYEF